MSDNAIPGAQVWRGEVRSATRADRTYTVTIFEYGAVCSCPDYIIRGVNKGQTYTFECKHIQQVLSEQRGAIKAAREEQMDTPPPAPIAELRPSQARERRQRDGLSDDEIRVIGRRGNSQR